MTCDVEKKKERKKKKKKMTPTPTPRFTDIRLNSPSVPVPAIFFGEGKRRKEFVEGYVEWRAEWHNYAKYDLRGE